MAPLTMHLLYHRLRVFPRVSRQIYRHVTSLPSPSENSEIVESKVEYPPIYDETFLGRRNRREEAFFDSGKLLPTVEEKLISISHPRTESSHFVLPALPLRYNTLPFRQYVTRTRVVRGLPTTVTDKNVDALYERLKPALVDALVVAKLTEERPPWMAETARDRLKLSHAVAEEKRKTDRSVDLIMRCLQIGMAKEFEHLEDCQVDVDARVEAYWKVGGFQPTKHKRRLRKKKVPSYLKESALSEDDPVQLNFIYNERPRLQLRTKNPLPPVISLNDSLSEALSEPSGIQEFPYYPKTIGHYFVFGQPILIPGFWPDDPMKFGHTSVYTREQLLRRRDLLNICAEDECLIEYGMLTSFAWLMGIATYQGFGPYIELEQPLTTQTVITDGNKWSFFVYQMNTSRLVSKHDENNRCNVCWASEDMKLYDTIEGNEVKGLNDDVFKLLIKFLASEPTLEAYPNPYVNQRVMDDVLWARMWDKLRSVYARRDRHTPKYHPFDWEKLYLFRNAFQSVNPRRKRY